MVVQQVLLVGFYLFIFMIYRMVRSQGECLLQGPSPPLEPRVIGTSFSTSCLVNFVPINLFSALLPPVPISWLLFFVFVSTYFKFVTAFQFPQNWIHASSKYHFLLHCVHLSFSTPTPSLQMFLGFWLSCVTISESMSSLNADDLFALILIVILLRTLNQTLASLRFSRLRQSIFNQLQIFIIFSPIAL